MMPWGFSENVTISEHPCILSTINELWVYTLDAIRSTVLMPYFFIFRYRMLKVRQLQHLTSLSENRGWVLIVAPLSTAILGLYFNQHLLQFTPIVGQYPVLHYSLSSTALSCRGALCFKLLGTKVNAPFCFPDYANVEIANSPISSECKGCGLLFDSQWSCFCHYSTSATFVFILIT